MDQRTVTQIRELWANRILAALDQLGQTVNATNLLLQNTVVNSAGLAIKSGGGSPDFLTANTVYYMIAGKLYSVAAAADTAMTAAAQQGNTLVSAHLVVVDAAGTISTIAGTPAAAGPVVPACPADQAALGIIQVTTDGSHTFTAGTTHLDATGVTVAYVNFVGGLIQPVLPTAFPAVPSGSYTSAGGLDITGVLEQLENIYT
jgi:hypothetical protein